MISWTESLIFKITMEDVNEFKALQILGSIKIFNLQI